MTKEYSIRGVALPSSSKEELQQFAAALQARMNQLVETSNRSPVFTTEGGPGSWRYHSQQWGHRKNDPSLKSLILPLISCVIKRFPTLVLCTLHLLCLAIVWFSEFLLFKKIFLFSNHRHWSVVYFIAGNILYAFYLSSGNHHNGK